MEKIKMVIFSIWIIDILNIRGFEFLDKIPMNEVFWVIVFIVFSIFSKDKEPLLSIKIDIKNKK